MVLTEVPHTEVNPDMKEDTMAMMAVTTKTEVTQEMILMVTDVEEISIETRTSIAVMATVSLRVRTIVTKQGEEVMAEATRIRAGTTTAQETNVMVLLTWEDHLLIAGLDRIDKTVWTAKDHVEMIGTEWTQAAIPEMIFEITDHGEMEEDPPLRLSIMG